MVEMVTLLVGIAVFAILVSGYLLRMATRQKAQAALRRRLVSVEEGGGDASLLLAEQRAGLNKLLVESGLGWSMQAFAVRAGGFGLAGLIAGTAFGGSALGFVAAALGAATPYMLAKRARAKRLALCNQQMIQVLEVMSLALRAGHPLPNALAVAATEAPHPICEELRRAIDEHELGRSIGDVLVALGERLEGCEAVRTLIVAVLVLQETGGNLIDVIQRIIDNARSRTQYFAKLKALTAEGRGSAWVVGCLPLVFLLIIMFFNPAYAKIIVAEPAGRAYVLIPAIVLWLLGIVWIRRLMKTEA
ncbi:MAG: type II secretion system F family protein [Pseudomonadota bacterium]